MIIRSSSRLNTVQEYYFSQKLAEIRQMQAEGKHVLNLGIGNPNGMPGPTVINRLQQEVQKPDVHGYQSYVGLPELKEAIAEWSTWAYEIDLNPETEILPLIGSKEGITHISLAFLDEGDQVLVPELAYPAYEAVANLCKAEVIRFPLDEDADYSPNWSFLENLDFSKVKLMWLNYPHMPTGAPADKEVFEKLVDLALKKQFIIAHDNPYSMILPSNRPLSIHAIKNSEEVALELNSLSKSFNMAGWRMGWVAGRADYIKTILKVKSNVDSGMFKPMMLAGIEALKMREAWFQQLNEMYKARRDIVWELLDKLSCKYNKNQQGMFVWAKVGNQWKSGRELVDKLLYENYLFITPGFIFGEKGEQFVRVSLCSSNEMLKESIDRLK